MHDKNVPFNNISRITNFGILHCLIVINLETMEQHNGYAKPKTEWTKLNLNSFNRSFFTFEKVQPDRWRYNDTKFTSIILEKIILSYVLCNHLSTLVIFPLHGNVMIFENLSHLFKHAQIAI